MTEGRGAVAITIKERIQALLDRYKTGLIVTSVNMQPAKPPEQVKAAFDDAIKAREDKERLENQAEAYSNEVLPSSRGEAARIVADAKAYRDRAIAESEGESARFSAILHEYAKAPEVTRQRLYLETMEDVLSKNGKAVLDVQRRWQQSDLSTHRSAHEDAASDPGAVRSSGAEHADGHAGESRCAATGGGPRAEDTLMSQSRTLRMFLPLGLAAVVIFFSSFTFVVQEYEIALKLRLGEIVSDSYPPGLHFKIPIINQIWKFDRRLQTLDAQPERFLTIEKKDVIVDSYAKWRIARPAQFLRSTGGNSARTGRLLSERINTSLRDEFGKRTIQEVVSDDRLALMELLTKEVNANAGDLGVEVIDVRVKKIDLPPEVSDSVYQRMRAERERVARDLRAKGGEAAERIRADADRQRTVTIAEAYKESEEIRGEGDAKSADIYAKAYGEDPAFYAFYRSLGAYRKSFGDGGSMMILEPDSEFFRFFREASGQP